MTRLTIACGVILAMSVPSLAVGQEKEGSSSVAVSADLGEKLDVYVARLKHGSVEQRREAVHALGQIGVAAKPGVPALREALKNKPPDFTVALALWKINKDASAVPALVEGLTYRESGWRGGCAHALGLIGVEAKAAVPDLIEALK